MNNTTGMGLDWSGLIGLLIIAGIFGFGNGFGFGGNTGSVTAAEMQMGLYNQTQDSNSRSIAASIASLNDSVLNNKYDNAILIKDISNQISNSVAAIGNQISNQTATITNLFNQQTIDTLRDNLAVTRDELSNTRQTATITNNILSNLATTAPKPPCYYGCGCANSLY